MKQIKAALLLLILLFVTTACNQNTVKNGGKQNEAAPGASDIVVRDWDNSKYEELGEMFKTGIGLTVANESSYTQAGEKSDATFAEIETLFVDDPDKPIKLKLNSNGKDRNFVLIAFYDYRQIPFKISQNGEYTDEYRFDLSAGKEIELPFYLPNDLPQDGVHKLLISFIIGHDMHFGDFEEEQDWFGISQIWDVIYNKADVYAEVAGNEKYTAASDTVDLTYGFRINRDYGFDILKTDVMKPMPTLIETTKGEEARFVYNASSLGEDYEDLMILLTLDFSQTAINGKDYELIYIPNGKTGVGEMSFTAPNVAGDYEVFAYLIYDPFGRCETGAREFYQSSQRFTLRVE